MESKIKVMHLQDCGFLCVLTILLWFSLIYMVNQINGLIIDNGVRTISYVSALFLGVFATTGMLAVLKHTFKNRIKIYTEDIKMSQIGKSKE